MQQAFCCFAQSVEIHLEFNALRNSDEIQHSERRSQAGWSSQVTARASCAARFGVQAAVLGTQGARGRFMSGHPRCSSKVERSGLRTYFIFGIGARQTWMHAWLCWASDSQKSIAPFGSRVEEGTGKLQQVVASHFAVARSSQFHLNC